MSRKLASEHTEQSNLVTWFRIQYPGVILNADLAGVNLTIGQAKKVKKQGHLKGFPDIFIAFNNGEYPGLFIEFKKKGTKVFKINGDVLANKHLQLQESIMQKLREQGYKAEFAIGFEEARNLIIKYMSNED